MLIWLENGGLVMIGFCFVDGCFWLGKRARMAWGGVVKGKGWGGAGEVLGGEDEVDEEEEGPFPDPFFFAPPVVFFFFEFGAKVFPPVFPLLRALSDEAEFCIDHK